MLIKIGICDDEELFCRELESKIKYILREQNCEICVANSGKDILQQVSEADEAKQGFDIVFLDIDMPEMDGLSVAKIIHEKYPDILIIFLTSYKDKMSKGYHVRAFRFLVKPTDTSELQEALFSAINEKASERCFFVNSYGVIKKISEKKIMYIRTVKDGCEIVCVDGICPIDDSLKNLMDKVDSLNFYKISKSHIVAFGYIKEIDGLNIKMADDFVIGIPRRNKRLFDEARAKYSIRKMYC